MSWKDQPRDRLGRWQAYAEAMRIYNTDGIPLPDELLPRSLGAMWQNYAILMPDGTHARFVEGTRLQNKEAFAGKGCKRKIDCVNSLVRRFGGKAEEWQKLKAIAYIRLPNGEIEKAEVHWYEEPSVGKKRFKYKGKGL